MSGYPPAPWHLGGQAALTVWRVAMTDVPDLPRGVRPARLAGRATVVTAFIDYTGPTLSYRELLAAVAVRRGRGLAWSITDIWVDNEASLAGGRELWGVPKQHADFRGLTATDRHGPIALADFTAPRLPVPRVRVPTTTATLVQTRGDRVLDSRLRAAGRARPASSDWTFPAGNRLAWLRGARSISSLVAEPFTLEFGAAGDAPEAS